MEYLARHDVVGATIVEVFQTYRLMKGWLDSTSTYFRIDSGLTFRMPYIQGTWRTERIPWRARRLRFEAEQNIEGSRITGVYVEPKEGEDWDPSEAIKLLLEDGRWVTERMVAPHGTGDAGLWVHKAGTFDLSNHLDFWDMRD